MILAAQMFEGLIAWGYLGIILYMILTGLGLPMPEEVAIIAGGALAASGKLDPVLTLASLLIGALLGDIVMYYVGYHFGRRILKMNRIWAGYLTPERELKVEKLLSRHGAKVLFVARFLVGLRGPIYITAGILKMPFRKFILADLVCATVVVTLFFGVSYIYGQQIARLIKHGEGVFTLVVITAVVIAAAVFIWYQLRRKRMPVAVPGMQEVFEDAQEAIEKNGEPSHDEPSSNEAADSNGEDIAPSSHQHERSSGPAT
jgi:membrane protein DedA with SNARE-associated domain